MSDINFNPKQITKKFSCTENTENGGTHLWLDNEYNEPSIHIMGQWDNGLRKELVVCLGSKQLEDLAEQFRKLAKGFEYKKVRQQDSIEGSCEEK